MIRGCLDHNPGAEGGMIGVGVSDDQDDNELFDPPATSFLQGDGVGPGPVSHGKLLIRRDEMEGGRLVEGSSGLKAIRVELVPKDMVQAGTQGLASWIKTTWLPYIERVPADLRMDIIDEIADEYLRAYPPDDRGRVHVQMMRLEVVAENE